MTDKTNEEIQEITDEETDRLKAGSSPQEKKKPTPRISPTGTGKSENEVPLGTPADEA